MYGKALLEHAIQQSSVLGGVTEKKSNKELEAVVAAAGGAIGGSSTCKFLSLPLFFYISTLE
jgi:hypothetical protein